MYIMQPLAYMKVCQDMDPVPVHGEINDQAGKDKSCSDSVPFFMPTSLKAFHNKATFIEQQTETRCCVQIRPNLNCS